MLTEKQRFGLKGELWVFEQIQLRDYEAILVSDFFNDIDLIIGGMLKVEVKSARRKQHKYQAKAKTGRKRYQFNLQGLSSKEEILVVCVCVTEDEKIAFCIPSTLFTGMGRRGLYITSHPAKYSGWAAAFREKWEVIEELLRIKQENSIQLMLPLFGGTYVPA